MTIFVLKQNNMIRLTYGDESFELRNESHELKLKEFEKIYNILNSEGSGKLEQYSQVFISLGIPEDVVDEMSMEEFTSIVKNFNAIKTDLHNLVPKLEIEGYTYTAHDGEFKFKTKDLITIEKAARQHIKNFPSFVLAVAFKRDDLSKKEHYDAAHLNHKAKIFSEYVTADVAIPYLALVSKKVVENISDEVDGNKH